MQDERTQAVASYLSLNKIEDNSNNEIEQVRTNNYIELTKYIWVGNSGASSHMFISLDGMFDMKEYKIPIRFGNKSELYATQEEKMRGIPVSKSRNKNPILLNDINFAPGLHCNLLSLSKNIKSFEITGKEDLN